VRIELAAIKTKEGVVLTGKSHAAIIRSQEPGVCKNGVQGFVTDDGAFVDRVEAAEIAFSAGQTKKRENILMSEDITGDWPWKKENESKNQ